jgi:choline monooxygenase
MATSENVRSIPASWYHDQGVYVREQQCIFARNWIFVGHSENLKEQGHYVTSTIAGQPIVIVCNGPENLNGFLNLCRHRASQICSDESGQIPRFTCPYHAWSYDLAGRLINAPGFSGIEHSDFSLIPIRVDSWNGLVFACLDPEVESLESWLGDINQIANGFPSVTEMSFASVRSNNCDANWKNYSDNSAEGYHLGTIHPGLNHSLVKNQTRIEAHANGKFVGFEVVYRGTHVDSPGYWIYKFPGMLMHFSMEGFNIERVIPVDATHTRLERWFWFMPGVSGKDQEETIAFSNQVMEEDLGICARVQTNLEGGVYDTGLLSAEREPGTILFQQCVREALHE